MEATMKCPKCGLVQERRVVFCKACRAVLVEPVVPGSIASMDPKLLTWGRQRIICGLICLLVFAWIAYVPKKTPPEIAPKQIEEASSKRINEKGKAIAERLEAECDYWGFDKYNSDGTVTVFKAIYGTWGRSEAMFLPKSSWEALSSEEKGDLIDYVSRGWPDGHSVSRIIVGQVIPSPRSDNLNAITIDTVVWP